MLRLKMKAKLSTIADNLSTISYIYLCYCKNGLVRFFLFTDDLIFMFAIKILILNSSNNELILSQ